MAFGKNKDHLRANFVQQARRTMNRPKGERRGAPYFVNQYKPPTHGSDTVRLIPGQFSLIIVDHDNKCIMLDDNDAPVTETIPYWPYTEHYHGTMKKSMVCSAPRLT